MTVMIDRIQAGPGRHIFEIKVGYSTSPGVTKLCPVEVELNADQYIDDFTADSATALSVAADILDKAAFDLREAYERHAGRRDPPPRGDRVF